MLSFPRFLAAILSALILAAAAYLLWTWCQGEWVRDGDVLVRMRDDWRLWVGGGLLAWSFLGRLIIPLILAKGGGRRTTARYGQGRIEQGASGSSLYVEEYGPAGAPVLLFTHGWGMDSTFWDYARQDLGDRFRLVLWDLPGLGRSKRPSSGRIALSDFAADLAGLLEKLDRPTVLIGHSIGGITIQTLVRDHPKALDRVAGVVLLNTTYTNPLRTMVGAPMWRVLQKPILEPAMQLTVWLSLLVWLSKWQSYLSGSTHAAMRFGFGKEVTRSQLEHVSWLSTRAAPGVEARGNLAMFRWDGTGALADVSRPVLVVGGDLDIVTKLEASEVIAGESGGALRVAHGANHMGPLESAKYYSELIETFALSLQSVSRESAI
ncbi:MAG: alpha/beta hydrolase [Caulobacteraceae bacterium]|nr:alpha/beta hydrolase [Caulobacteraceae bacterium]